MNVWMKKYRVFSFIVYCITFIGVSSPLLASCLNNGHKISDTKIGSKTWNVITDKDFGLKQAIFFNDNKGGLVKLGAGYKNLNHHFEKDISAIVIDGDVEITSNGETTTYSQGDYYEIPANACLSSFSKKGALVAILGARPGESKK